MPSFPSYVVSLLAAVSAASATTVSVTPHDKYSSSIGVLGCKIDVNRVAYWPSSPDPEKFCIKLTKDSNSVYLLHIDSSEGAYDISYDAWVQLQTGKSATDEPLTGGGVDVEVEYVDPSKCAHLLKTPGKKMPFSASNSMNFLSSCGSDSWIAKNHILYNILDPVCSSGYDEECTLSPPNNQADCPHTLGLNTKLTTTSVVNIEYGTGRQVDANSGKETSGAPPSEDGSNNGSEDEDDHDSDSESTPYVAPTSSQAVVAPTSTTSSTTTLSSSTEPVEVASTTPSSEVATPTADSSYGEYVSTSTLSSTTSTATLPSTFTTLSTSIASTTATSSATSTEAAEECGTEGIVTSIITMTRPVSTSASEEEEAVTTTTVSSSSYTFTANAESSYGGIFFETFTTKVTLPTSSAAQSEVDAAVPTDDAEANNAGESTNNGDVNDGAVFAAGVRSSAALPWTVLASGLVGLMVTVW